ncbi:hypothetical protein BTM25_36930 [Actinomadura rubteroloni]|uniref:Uncharacterized protein n=1 Tax=Actinomadura rubteroloni TaxID=1926885 RepID=A0A2P4UJ47_9ACTN|nr:hypothetical protein [Actinomadura rubteroloni]POM25051.1 hypothetical protein BTM25_36930 [Actinomadura rubteroloni]
MRSKRRGRSDRGASGLEWAALLVVGATIFAVLLALAIPEEIGRVVPPALCRIFGGHCQTPPKAKDSDFKPKTCERSASEQKYGGTIKIAIVKVGKEWSFLRQEMADGTVRLTVVPNGDTVGLEVGAGGKISLGKNVKLGAEITVAGSIKVGVGDTYVFKNGAEADKFQGDIKELATRDTAKSVAENVIPGMNNPITGWVVDKVDDLTGRPHIKDPEITTTTISYKESVEGSLGLYLPQIGPKGDGSDDWNLNINTGLKGKVEYGEDVAVTQDNTDPSNPRTSYFVGMSGTLSGSGEVLGAGGEGELKWTGGERLVFDKDGKLIAVTFQTTFEKGGRSNGKIGGNYQDGKGNGKDKDGAKTVETVTQTVPLDNDADRAAMARWLQENPTHMPLSLLKYMGGDDDVVRTDPGPNASVFDRLLYQKGQVLKQTTENTNDSFEIGAEAKLGLVLGAEYSQSSSTNRTTGAEYLGAPRSGRREFVPYTECVG